MNLAKRYPLFSGHGQFVTGDQTAHLLQREGHELLTDHDISEVLLCLKQANVFKQKNVS